MYRLSLFRLVVYRNESVYVQTVLFRLVVYRNESVYVQIVFVQTCCI